MAGGVHGRGVCGRGACVAGVVCMAGGHAWWGAWQVGGGHAWQGGIAWHSVHELAVRILLECILVVLSKYQNMLDTDVGQINLNSLHHDKCESAFKFIHQVNLFNLIP